MKNIIIFGGGRWARIILSELISSKKCKKILVVTPNNYDFMTDWVRQSNFAEIIKVNYNCMNLKAYDGCIVANKALDHYKTAIRTIKVGIPTLIEKPYTLATKDVKRLISAAKISNTVALPAYVYNFCHYIEKFKKIVRLSENIKGIKFIWTDEIFENRYGETKYIDKTISIFDDILPHILSILNNVFEEGFEENPEIIFSNMKSFVQININMCNIKAEIILSNNYIFRQRNLSFVDKNGYHALDFSNESWNIDSAYLPENNQGKIIHNSMKTMLCSFLDGIDLNRYDERFDVTNLKKNYSLIEKLNNKINDQNL